MFPNQFRTRPWSAWSSLFREMDDIRKRMNSMQDAESPWAGLPAADVFPLINVSENDDAYFVRAELPGVNPSDLDISVTGASLALSGKREISAREGASYHRRERKGGAFNRMITLPGDIQGDKVAASCANGVLTVALPKAEAAKPKKITVKI